VKCDDDGLTKRKKSCGETTVVNHKDLARKREMLHASDRLPVRPIENDNHRPYYPVKIPKEKEQKDLNDQPDFDFDFDCVDDFEVVANGNERLLGFDFGFDFDFGSGFDCVE